MVPPSSDQVSRVWPYSGTRAALAVFIYVTLTLFGWPSHAILLTLPVLKAVRTPKGFLLSFHLSFTVLYAIGHWVVFRVGGWSPRIPTRFHVSGRTLEFARLLSFSPTWFSHSLTGLPMPFG